MYYQPYAAGQAQPLSKDNHSAITVATKEYDTAGSLLPPQDEFTVLRDPPSFVNNRTSTAAPVTQPTSPNNNTNNEHTSMGSLGSVGSGSLNCASATTIPAAQTLASFRSNLKLFSSAIRPAPPRAGADLNAPLIQLTPRERETNRLSRSGRQLSELEILQDKHEIEFRRVVPVVAQALKDVVAQHESLIRNGAQRDERYATYETNAVPSIRVDDYVQRIAEYTYISPATLIASLIILDRLSQRHPQLLFTMLNIYKLFFVAVRIGSKVVDLRTLNNKNFASVGGISNRHLNEVEARMLSDLRFDLYINPNEVLVYMQKAFGIASFIPKQLSVVPSPHSPTSLLRSPNSGSGGGITHNNNNGNTSGSGSSAMTNGHGGQHYQNNHLTTSGGGLAGVNNPVGNSLPTPNQSRSPSQLGSRMASRRGSVGVAANNNNSTSMPPIIRPPDGESPANRPNVRRRTSSAMAGLVSGGGGGSGGSSNTATPAGFNNSGSYNSSSLNNNAHHHHHHSHYQSAGSNSGVVG